MISLEARQASSRYETEHPDVSIHEAFLQGYLFAKEQQTPFFVDDAPMVVVQDSTPIPAFEDFWELYDKKRGKPKVKKKWDKLPLVDKLDIMAYIPKYKLAQPDKQYRKDPYTFLNQEAWKDELIYSNTNTNARPTPEQQERTFLEQGLYSILESQR